MKKKTPTKSLQPYLHPFYGFKRGRVQLLCTQELCLLNGSFKRRLPPPHTQLSLLSTSEHSRHLGRRQRQGGRHCGKLSGWTAILLEGWNFYIPHFPEAKRCPWRQAAFGGEGGGAGWPCSLYVCVESLRLSLVSTRKGYALVMVSRRDPKGYRQF